MPVLDEVPAGARVAIIRLRSLGDCVLATPAIRLLKAARPDLRLGVVVDSAWTSIYEENADVAEILRASVRTIRAWAPRLVLNLHGGTTSARLTALSGARWRAGFAHFRHQFIYNFRILRAQEILGVERKVHTAEHAASAMFALGVPPREIPRACVFATTLPARKAYAVIHPMASEPGKTWAAANFIAVAHFLREEAGLEPVFLGAPDEDLAAFQSFRVAQGQSLRETKSLIAGASFFIGNDSGPAHLAAAFGIPCTVLFGPSDPEIWGPWRTPSHVLQARPIADITTAQAIQSVAELAAIGSRV